MPPFHRWGNWLRGAGPAWLHTAPVCAQVTPVRSLPPSAAHPAPALSSGPSLMGVVGSFGGREAQRDTHTCLGPHSQCPEFAKVWGAWREGRHGACQGWCHGLGPVSSTSSGRGQSPLPHLLVILEPDLAAGPCWVWTQFGNGPRASLGPHSAPSQPPRVTRRGLTALSLFLPQVGGDVAGAAASGQVGQPHQSGLYSCPQPLHKNTLIPFHPWETGSER